MSIHRTVNGIMYEIKEEYNIINGVLCQIKEQYCSFNGVNKLVFPNGVLYKKYTSVGKYEYEERTSSTWMSYSKGSSFSWISCYTGYIFDKTTGIYTLQNYIGQYRSDSSLPLQYPYNLDQTSKYIVKRISEAEHTSSSVRYDIISYYSAKVTVYYKGTYIEDVKAPEGTYPANGRHTDGYWYVLEN